MKQESTAIEDFARANQLEQTPEGICFDAGIFVYSQQLSARFESEVHIISTGAMHYRIFILHPSPGLDTLPSVYESGFVDISYQATKGLIIRCNIAPMGPCKILLQLVNDCRDSTTAEIRSKLYN